MASPSWTCPTRLFSCANDSNLAFYQRVWSWSDHFESLWYWNLRPVLGGHQQCPGSQLGSRSETGGRRFLCWERQFWLMLSQLPYCWVNRSFEHFASFIREAWLSSRSRSLWFQLQIRLFVVGLVSRREVSTSDHLAYGSLRSLCSSLILRRRIS